MRVVIPIGILLPAIRFIHHEERNDQEPMTEKKITENVIFFSFSSLKKRKM